MQPSDNKQPGLRPTRSARGRRRRRHTPRSRWKQFTPQRLVTGLTCVNLVGVGLLWIGLFALSERYWLTSVLTFLPRVPWLVPSLLLIVAGIIWNRRSIPFNVVAAGFVLLAIMEYCWGFNAAPLPDGAQQLRVVSCNVQRFEPRFELVLEEISRANPDVVFFQEARDSHPLFRSYFSDWHTVHQAEFFIASRWPIQYEAICHANAYSRPSAMHAVLMTPSGPIDLFNVHVMTPRHGLAEISPRTLLSGEAADAIDHHLYLREAEAVATRQFIVTRQSTGRTIIAGDFNAPTSSSMVADVWNRWTSAFDAAGCGFGYTAPCSDHSLWLDRIPWVRIDHILVGPQFGVSSAEAGKKNGSDHRAMSAQLWFQPQK